MLLLRTIKLNILLIYDEGASAPCNFSHTLELALFGLAGAALRHKLIACHHVTLGLLNLFLNRIGSRLDHGRSVEGNFETNVAFFVLWVVIPVILFAPLLVLLLISLHLPDKFGWLISSELSC